MNIKQILEKYTCLDNLGEPIKRTRNGWLYRCPWREDKHPSLTVTLNGKGWKDQATGEHGNIIDLVAKDKHMTKREVCAWFDTFHPSSSFDPQKSYGGKEKDGFLSFEVVPLHSRGLYAYLTSRCINTSIARQFLQEAHYSFHERDDGRYLYALAYPNDQGGYELRGAPYTGNPNGYKGCTAPKAITTHFSLPSAPVVVFEGFFDMLSFASLCGGIRHNYITLNSVINAPAAIEKLRDYSGRIYLALDNDDKGRETTKMMLQQLPKAIDIRERFAPHKDINDYLCQKRKDGGLLAVAPSSGNLKPGVPYPP